jgi:hypothetical protein
MFTSTSDMVETREPRTRRSEMKVKVPLILLLLLAAAVGYLLATEKGRGQRDQIIVKVRERRGGEAPSESADVAASAD